MSLVVWLPLNGNLENQGLSNVTVTNHGATVDNNGKIGKCYKFNNQYMTMPMTNLNANNGLTLSCWVYPTANASGNTHLVTFAPGAGWSYNRFGLFLRNGTTSVITTASDGTNTINYTCQSSALPLNTWTHVCSTYSNRKLTVYLNGVQNITYNITFDISLNGIDSLNVGGCKNGNETLANCKLNDVRFYNHCLSAKEVKELAKGLVLHYRLAGPGQENLLTGTGPNDSGWNVCQSGGTATRTVTSDCTTFNVTAKATQWFLYAHNLPSWIRNSLKTNTIYTYSFETKSTANFNLNISLLCLDGKNPMSNNRVVSIIGDNQWHQYSVQLTTIASFSSLSRTDQCFYMNGGNVISTVSFRNAKLEEGSIATPWCPNPKDALYSTMGYNIEYDCSGYRHNGTQSGNITWDVDSPRYTTSYKFPNNTNTKIFNTNVPKFTKNLTFSCWANVQKGSHATYSFLMSQGRDNPADGFNIMLNSATHYCVYGPFGTLDSGVAVDNTWKHIVGTYDGANIKIYINGELKNTLVYTGDLVYNYAPAFVIGKMAYNYTNNDSYFPTNGKLSDIRVYATALSAEDIAELYHTSAMVDNNGNTYAYEYLEA